MTYKARFACEYGPKRGPIGTGPRREQKRSIERAKLVAVRKMSRDLHEACRLGISVVELEQKRKREIAAARQVAALPPAVVELGDPIAQEPPAPVKKPRKTAAKKAVEAPSAPRSVNRAVDFNLSARKQSKRASNREVQ